jgi:calcineurin-like phosphoesterase family protein
LPPFQKGFVMDYFTADTHFDHRGIIGLCKRPFQDVEHMNSVIINNINEVAGQNDRIFHLGDFSYRINNRVGGVGTLRNLINCPNIFLVPGNHDREKELAPYFTILSQCYMYQNPQDNFKIVLCHYAMRVWPRSHHGVTHLYGHSHGCLPPVPGVPSFDVGVDCWNYRPLSIFEVQHEMKRLCALAPARTEHLHHANLSGCR